MRKQTSQVSVPARIGDPAEIDYGRPAAPDFGPLARDKIPVRAMKESDLPGIVAIDRRITGRNRSDYFSERLAEALFESDVRVSLLADRGARYHWCRSRLPRPRRGPSPAFAASGQFKHAENRARANGDRLARSRIAGIPRPLRIFALARAVFRPLR